MRDAMQKWLWFFFQRTSWTTTSCFLIIWKYWKRKGKKFNQLFLPIPFSFNKVHLIFINEINQMHVKQLTGGEWKIRKVYIYFLQLLCFECLFSFEFPLQKEYGTWENILCKRYRKGRQQVTIIEHT